VCGVVGLAVPDVEVASIEVLGVLGGGKVT
jgi:hypothetical protein